MISFCRRRAVVPSATACLATCCLALRLALYAVPLRRLDDLLILRPGLLPYQRGLILRMLSASIVAKRDFMDGEIGLSLRW